MHSFRPRVPAAVINRKCLYQDLSSRRWIEPLAARFRLLHAHADGRGSAATHAILLSAELNLANNHVTIFAVFAARCYA